MGVGTLEFADSSSGGDATVETLQDDTRVEFWDDARAEKMVIANRFGDVFFNDRSTGGDAELVNHSVGRSYFYSVGPQRDGIVTIGAIRNDGLLVIGDKTSLVVRRDLVLDLFPQARVRFEIRASRCGSVAVRGNTRLGGDLIVQAPTSNVALGQHTLITAKSVLTSRFRRHRFIGFPANLRPRIAYSGRAVNLIVEPR